MNKKNSRQEIKYRFVILIKIALLFVLPSCVVSYSLLSPAAVPVEAKTFSVTDFVNTSDLAPNFLNRLFADELIDIIQNRSRLRFVASGGDLVFEGKITGYQIDVVGIQSNAVASQNTLRVTVRVSYTNPYDEEKSFEQDFSQTESYDALVQLNTIEQQVNTPIVESIVLQIFNKAFGQW